MITIRQLTAHSVKPTTKIRPLLENISCDIPTGRITTLIGKSGAGKTTLLRCIAGLQSITQGTVYLEDKNIAHLSTQERATLVGFVFQNFNLFPTMTALQNCTHPLVVVQQLPADKARSKALKILSKLGMEPYLESYPSQLSGGQQQRVALARALALEPQVLLLDEPSSGLDPQNSMILIQILQELCKEESITVILASQDMAFVRILQDSVYLVIDGEITQDSVLISQFLNFESATVKI